MAYKCRICGSNDVDNQGDICELCAIGQDPYAIKMSRQSTTSTSKKARVLCGNPEEMESTYIPKHENSRKVLLNGGADLTNKDLYGNLDRSNQTVQVYSAGQVPPQAVTRVAVSASVPKAQSLSKNEPICAGIVRNYATNEHRKTFVSKWFSALFKGIPFTTGNQVTTFQVFPDYTGTSRNVLGNACDQVIIYGKITPGMISDNNDIEVYGKRDSNNNVQAKYIKNKATGTNISPVGSMSCGIVWCITLLMLVFLVSAVTTIINTVKSIETSSIIMAVIIILCLLNLRLVFKIIGFLLKAIFSILKKIFF